MARSKRTERAEARRRYRAYLAEQAELEGATTDEIEEDAPAREPARPAREAAPVLRPGQRMGFFAAISAARRPVHYVEDLRYTRQLITGTPAVWLPTLIAIGSAGVAIARLNGSTVEAAKQDAAVQITLGFVLNPYMPMLPALIAGFFAPRATWLAGLMVSFVTTVAYVVVLVIGANSLSGTGTKLIPGDAVVYAGSLMLVALPFGAVLAAFSGWYKRFLALTGPAAAMAQQRGAQKQAAKRQASRRSAR